MARRRGWHREPARHSLAARGMRTALSKPWHVPYKAKGGKYRQARQMLEDYEREGGVCPHCGKLAEYRVCSQCDKAAWIIDCGHYDQPRPISAGRIDGSESHKLFCDDCGRDIGGYPSKSGFLWYTDADLAKIKKYAVKERSFASMGRDFPRTARMSQKEAMKILSDWGEILNPAEYSIPKFARDPRKWYTHLKHTGWRKGQSATTRRAKLLASTPKNWTKARRYRLAARRAQALANVTQDRETAVLSKADADYFFNKLAELRR